MLRDFACVTFIAVSLVACGKTPETERELSADRLIAAADTFHLTFSNGRIISVTTSSNDPQEYYDAERWVEKNRPEFVGESCKRYKDRPSTPGDCVRGYVRGFLEFIEVGGLSEGFSISE